MTEEQKNYEYVKSLIEGYDTAENLSIEEIVSRVEHTVTPDMWNDYESIKLIEGALAVSIKAT